MQIKYQQIQSHLKQGVAPLYLITGQEPFLIQESALMIKHHFSINREVERTIIAPQNIADWHSVFEQANSYSLFSDASIIDVQLSKPSFDKQTKESINGYLKNPADFSLVIIQTGHMTTREFQWLSKNDRAVVIPCYTLSSEQLFQWIKNKLSHNKITIEHGMIELMVSHTQGNLLASDQLIQKLILCYGNNVSLSNDQVGEQLFDSTHYQLFDLTDACLNGQVKQALHILERMQVKDGEQLLILWLLTKEINVLLMLHHLIQSMPFSNACAQVKIWPQKQPTYQRALKKLSVDGLNKLLVLSQKIDMQLKSGRIFLAKHKLESMVIALSTGKILEAACKP